ncbi:DctP family TRAP transporter solute-binding subunit [Sediminivirga luteola]|uniref:ABC transporter substrate-binding protein n=1 Tax=Sediminivirga luteola TaxID=1774748 RepID=A0A8J2U070_9MICO|nr:DctP family TRAP transporter solute-binding subunit [Sediminivirga luteola]GGA23424.1 ABC transporter substrate-binding protein [Sediminivirga luteola]
MAPHQSTFGTHRLPRLAVAGLAVASLALAGCVGTEAPQSNQAAADADARHVRFAHVYDPSHPVETCGVPAINESLQDSGLVVDSYPAAQLGSEAESLEQVASGGLDLAVAGPSFLGVWEENVALFDAPYLFRDVDHFEATLNGPIGDEIWAGLKESSGLDVLSSWYYGTRHVTANNEVHTSDDLAGQKLRAADAPLYLTMAEIMGGAATPMALDEAYLALQQGTIDAQENPIPTIASQKFYEVQDYLNLTGHMIQGVMVVASESSLGAFSAEEQDALRTAAAEAQTAVRECIEDQEASFLEEWRESGEITVNDDVDVEHFRQRAADLIPERFPWGERYLEIQES